MAARRQPSYYLTGHHDVNTNRVETEKCVKVTVECKLVLCDETLVEPTLDWLSRNKLRLPKIKLPVVLAQLRHAKQTLTWEFSLTATFSEPSNPISRFFRGRPEAMRKLQPKEVFEGFVLGLEEVWRYSGRRKIVSPWPHPKLHLRHIK